MELRGKLHSVSRDFTSKNLILSLKIDDNLTEEMVEELQQIEDMDIILKKHKEKRSLDANAYLWVICTKLAEKRECSKEEVYEEMLQHYGNLQQDEDGNYILITLKSSIDTSKLDGHWKFYKQSDDGRFKSYLMIKGSSEYDTSEMARFIDMVVRDAEQEGIQTLPPSEIQMMKERWGI